MTLRPILLSILTLSLPVTAQTQLLRGDVDSISGTNRYQVDCTNLEIVSSTVDLRALHDASRRQDIDYEMRVRPTTVGGRAVLEVVAATPIPEQMDMGNLRFGRNETWEVFGPAGSEVWIFVNVPSASSYLPLGAAGSWLLGTALPFRTGQIDGFGRLRFGFTMPTIPALVGRTISSQAVLRSNGVFSITAPDCKEVRND